MTKIEYREYLASPHWQATRREMLRTQAECNQCYIPRWLANLRDGQDFNVHHRSYVNLGNERPEDLEVLCHRCHQLEHSIGPSIYCYHCDVPLYGILAKPALCCECSKTRKFVRLGDNPMRGIFGIFEGNPDDLVLVGIERDR